MYLEKGGGVGNVHAFRNMDTKCAILKDPLVYSLILFSIFHMVNTGMLSNNNQPNVF